MRLSRRPEPFDSDDYIFELKIEGFRSLAYIKNGHCDLVSRSGNIFPQLQGSRGRERGEPAHRECLHRWRDRCVDDSGRSIFNDPLFRRRDCLFFAFDLLHLNGQDLRGLPLIEKKAQLKRLLRRKRPRIIYVNHIETDGQRLFEKVCNL
jgi:bifunctional non-homologous end joining protein LigD